MQNLVGLNRFASACSSKLNPWRLCLHLGSIMFAYLLIRHVTKNSFLISETVLCS